VLAVGEVARMCAIGCGVAFGRLMYPWGKTALGWRYALSVQRKAG
jgi:hypothetical protein